MTSAKNAPRSIDELDERITRPTEKVLAAIDACAGEFLVLGAAGKMGFHVTGMLQRSLQELGRRDRITAVSRFSSPESRVPFDRCGVRVVETDLSDTDQVARVPTAENVFYLAGIKFGTSGSAGLLKRMNVTMPELVASRFRDSRIVALSTGCVYSFTTPDSGGSTEESPTDPPGDYARSCLQREQAFLAGSLQYGTRCALHSTELFERASLRRSGRYCTTGPRRNTDRRVDRLRQRDLARRRDRTHHSVVVSHRFASVDHQRDGIGNASCARDRGAIRQSHRWHTDFLRQRSTHLLAQQQFSRQKTFWGPSGQRRPHDRLDRRLDRARGCNAWQTDSIPESRR